MIWIFILANSGDIDIDIDICQFTFRFGTIMTMMATDTLKVTIIQILIKRNSLHEISC